MLIDIIVTGFFMMIVPIIICFTYSGNWSRKKIIVFTIINGVVACILLKLITFLLTKQLSTNVSYAFVWSFINYAVLKRKLLTPHRSEGSNQDDLYQENFENRENKYESSQEIFEPTDSDTIIDYTEDDENCYYIIKDIDTNDTSKDIHQDPLSSENGVPINEPSETEIKQKNNTTKILVTIICLLFIALIYLGILAYNLYTEKANLTVTITELSKDNEILNREYIYYYNKWKLEDAKRLENLLTVFPASRQTALHYEYSNTVESGGLYHTRDCPKLDHTQKIYVNHLNSLLRRGLKACSQCH